MTTQLLQSSFTTQLLVVHIMTTDKYQSSPYKIYNRETTTSDTQEKEKEKKKINALNSTGCYTSNIKWMN